MAGKEREMPSKCQERPITEKEDGESELRKED